MNARERFKVGDIVVISAKAREARIWSQKPANRIGRIMGHSTCYPGKCVSVQWEGNMTSTSCHHTFLNHAVPQVVPRPLPQKYYANEQMVCPMTMTKRFEFP